MYAFSYALKAETAFGWTTVVVRVEARSVIRHGEFKTVGRQCAGDRDVMGMTMADGVQGQFADDA